MCETRRIYSKKWQNARLTVHKIDRCGTEINIICTNNFDRIWEVVLRQKGAPPPFPALVSTHIPKNIRLFYACNVPILTAQDKALKQEAPLQALTTTRRPTAGPYYNMTPHSRPSLQHDAQFQTLTTTRRPISDHHYNTTPHCRPSLQHDANLQALTTTKPYCRPSVQHEAPFQALTTTRRFLAGPHYNTTPLCRPSLQQDAPLRSSLQHDAPLQTLTTTRRPIASPHYNTTPLCRPSLQHDTPLQALTIRRETRTQSRYQVPDHTDPQETAVDHSVIRGDGRQNGQCL